MNPLVRRILGEALFPTKRPVAGPPVPSPYPYPNPYPADWPPQTSEPIPARQE
jgi:hypothetical protein